MGVTRLRFKFDQHWVIQVGGVDSGCGVVSIFFE